MIILLKIILGLLATANIFVLDFVIKDFFRVRKTEGFDNLSIWERIKFSSVFYFVSTALISLLVFLIYFVIISIHIS